MPKYIAIIPLLLLSSCASLPQNAAPTTTGQHNKVETTQKQSVADFSKEITAKPDVSGSQNKTNTSVNEAKVLYAIIALVGTIVAGLFYQMRQQAKYQLRRLEIYQGKSDDSIRRGDSNR